MSAAERPAVARVAAALARLATDRAAAGHGTMCMVVATEVEELEIQSPSPQRPRPRTSAAVRCSTRSAAAPAARCAAVRSDAADGGGTVRRRRQSLDTDPPHQALGVSRLSRHRLRHCPLQATRHGSRSVGTASTVVRRERQQRGKISARRVRASRRLASPPRARPRAVPWRVSSMYTSEMICWISRPDIAGYNLQNA